MSWNYRIIKTCVDEGGNQMDWFAVHEVYYTRKEGGEDYDNINLWSADPIDVSGESLDDIRSTLDMMTKALDKQILDMAELQRRADDRNTLATAIP